MSINVSLGCFSDGATTTLTIAQTNQFEQLYSQSLRAVNHHAELLWHRSYPGCSPEDLVSETYLRAWKGFHNFDQARVNDPTSWFLKILSRVHYDATTRAKRIEEIELSADLTPDHQFSDPRKYENLLDALSELKPIDQELLYGHYWAGYLDRELAQIHGIKPANARGRIKRARDKLRSTLEKYAA